MPVRISGTRWEQYFVQLLVSTADGVTLVILLIVSVLDADSFLAQKKGKLLCDRSIVASLVGTEKYAPKKLTGLAQNHNSTVKRVAFSRLQSAAQSVYKPSQQHYLHLVIELYGLVYHVLVPLFEPQVLPPPRLDESLPGWATDARCDGHNQNKRSIANVVRCTSCVAHGAVVRHKRYQRSTNKIVRRTSYVVHDALVRDKTTQTIVCEQQDRTIHSVRGTRYWGTAAVCL